MDLSILHPNKHHSRVAILIDGDNFPRGEVAIAEDAGRHCGDITVRRVFGDMALRKEWAQDTAYTAAHCPTTSGKNRADMMLVVSAMDMAHRGLATAFVIGSDDRDFGPLVNHLREQGYRVEWVGKKKPVPQPQNKTISKAKVATKSDNPPASTKMLKHVTAAVLGGGAAGFPIQSLGPALQKQGFKVSDTAQKTWRAWLLARDTVFICDPRGPDARVRLRSQPSTP